MSNDNIDEKPFIRLACQVQTYSYGKRGSKSLAAKYALATPENNFTIDEEQEYGEIWMGDHENGPSKSAATGTPLRDLVTKDPVSFLGQAVHRRFPDANNNPQIPFLFKVLSFDKALPLQAHPDKSLAEQLKKQEKEEKGKNEQFVDPNHKPECAIALSPVFEAFVGFRPVEEIRTFIKDVHELREMIGGETVQEFEDKDQDELERDLKELFGKIFETDQETVKKLTTKLANRARQEGDRALGSLGEKEYLSSVVQQIFSTYPHDAGLFAALFFMNFIRIGPGEGISVPADCIHAYLTGDCIECMANSDNMISCGFQGEMGPPDDASLFVKMLLNNPGPSKHHILKHDTFAKSRNNFTVKYDTPMEEFTLLRMLLPNASEEFLSIDGPAIYLVTKGDVEVSARAKDSEQGSLGHNTGGIDEPVASKMGLRRRGSELGIMASEIHKETLSEGSTIFAKPGFELCFWNKGTGTSEVYGAYCEV